MDGSYGMSLIGLVGQQANLGATLMMYPLFGESLISRARNIAASSVVHDREATHLLFIDADVTFRPELVKRLLDLDVDVATAAYPKKALNRLKMQVVHSELSELPENYEHLVTDFASEIDTSAEPRDVFETNYAATGMMLVKRRVFVKMAEAFPDIRYVNDVSGYDKFLDKDRTAWDFFYTGINPVTRKYESEDYGFTNRWREMGGKVWVIANETLGHRGKRTYWGNVKEQQTLFHEARKRIDGRGGLAVRSDDGGEGADQPAAG